MTLYAWAGPAPAEAIDPDDYTLAAQVTVNAQVTVRSIRVWSGANAVDLVGRKVRLWRAGVSLAVEAAPTALGAGWTEVALTAPQVLDPGDVVVVAFDTAGNYGYLADAFPQASADGALTFTDGLFSQPVGALPTTGSTGWYGVDLGYDLGDTTGANLAPSVALVMDPARGFAPLDVVAATVVDDPEGQPVTLLVDWGDGSVPDGGPGHTYAAAGVYVVQVTATDPQGAVGRAVAAVVVDPAPVPTGLLSTEDLAYMRETQAESRPTAADLFRRTVTRGPGGGQQETWPGPAEPVAVRIDGQPKVVPSPIADRVGDGMAALITMDMVLDVRAGDRIQVDPTEVYRLVSDGEPDVWATAQQVWAVRLTRPSR